jgi:hypothetical protein
MARAGGRWDNWASLPRTKESALSVPPLDPTPLALEIEPTSDELYGEDMRDAVAHASGYDDVAFAAMASPRMFGAAVTAAVSSQWLPEGHHWDLHIEHKPLENAGTFTGGGKKLCWHTTESAFDKVDLMWQVLRDKRAAPHFVIGGRPGLQHPVVIQTIPLDRAARALQHPAGTPQTNRANAIQVEICGFTAEAVDWPESRYKALANLFVLIRHRVAIKNKATVDFSRPRRLGGQEWVDAEGHVDHGQCPNNTHHDVLRFREGKLINLIENCPDGGYDL